MKKNSEYSITTSFFGKYFEFYKPFVNFISISLALNKKFNKIKIADNRNFELGNLSDWAEWEFDQILRCKLWNSILVNALRNNTNGI